LHDRQQNRQQSFAPLPDLIACSRLAQPYSTVAMAAAASTTTTTTLHYCIHLDILAWWLAGLNENLIRPEFAPRLVRFQKDIVRTANAILFGNPDEHAAPDDIARGKIIHLQDWLGPSSKAIESALADDFTAILRKVGLAGSEPALSGAALGAACLFNLLQICFNDDDDE
jgi:hypothetical protein